MQLPAACPTARPRSGLADREVFAIATELSPPSPSTPNGVRRCICSIVVPARRSTAGPSSTSGAVGGARSDPRLVLPPPAAADPAPAKKPKAEACIHIFLPGGIAHQETFDPKPFAPIEYRGELRLDRRPSSTASSSASPCRKTAADRRQDHGHPLDDARRGGPRARHAQHVHRLPAQPGAQSSRAWAASSATSSARGTTCRRTSAVPSMPTNFAGTGYLSSAFAPFSLGSDPANAGFTVQDLNLPGGVDDRPVRHAAARCSTRSTTTSPGRRRRDNLDGDGHLLPAGLQPDQLARRPARRSTSTPRPAKLRDEYGRNAAGQRMLMARRLVEAGVRFVTLTYGGWDLHAGIAGRHRAASCRRSTRRSPR